MDNGKRYIGFAGGTADAFTLSESVRTENSSSSPGTHHPGCGTGSGQQCGRTQMHQMEAMMLATDGDKIFLLMESGCD
jgi:ATP-dependent protease HslVU (ClpYQ) peptidase subunit